MAQTAQNVFNRVKDWAQGPFVVWVFFAACILWGIGANHFVEDTYSSYLGLQEVEALYNLVPATWPLTYWTMSLAPQIGQIVLTYVYFSNPRRNSWALLVVVLLLLVDFVADVYHRANGVVGWDIRTAWASGLTLGYFSVGSELFISVSTGVLLTTFSSAVVEVRRMISDIESSFSGRITRRGNQDDRSSRSNKKYGSAD